MAKHSKGKHAAPAGQNKAAEAVEPQAGAVAVDADSSSDASFVEAEEHKETETVEIQNSDTSQQVEVLEGVSGEATVAVQDATPGVRARTVAIVISSVVGFLAIVYFIGVAIFAGHYFPNTYVAGVDFSLKTPAEMSQTLDETLDNYSFSVVGKGMNFTVTSADANLSSDSVQVAEDILAEMSPWEWPLEIFQTRNLTEVFTQAIDADDLNAIVVEQVETANADAVLPTNATIAFDKDKNSYIAVAEVKGTAIDSDRLLETILSGLMNFDDRVVLTDEVLVQPTILVDDPRIDAAIRQADGYVKANFDLMIADNLVMTVNPELSSTWVSVDPELAVTFDEAALSTWAAEVAKSCNTVGSRRQYTRPDGKVITVSGGSYGWKIDNEALTTQVIEAVKAGSAETIAIPVVQSGTGFATLGGQDWGSRYVDVDLSEQYARFYDGGAIIWEANIVSGNPNKGNATPQGVWVVNAKQSPSILRGRMTSEGVPEYESKVQYWMPFQGNSVGFHDATWQSSFGGRRFLTNGSRGCINLSYNAAQSLYGILQQGDVVVVHS